MTMSVDALLAAIKKTVVTEEGIRKFHERLAESERQFEEKERFKRLMLPEILNKEFTL